MPQDIKLVRVFISYTSDLDQECDAIVDAIEELNATWAPQYDVWLAPMHFRKDISSEMGVPAQEIINRDLLNVCDIFIGLMWHSSGSEAIDGKTGLEIEFEYALAECAKGNSWPKVSMFFKEDYSGANPDPEKLNRMLALKRRVQEEGFYEKFDKITNLQSRVRIALYKHVERELGSAQEEESVGVDFNRLDTDQLDGLIDSPTLLSDQDMEFVSDSVAELDVALSHLSKFLEVQNSWIGELANLPSANADDEALVDSAIRLNEIFRNIADETRVAEARICGSYENLLTIVTQGLAKLPDDQEQRLKLRAAYFKILKIIPENMLRWSETFRVGANRIDQTAENADWIRNSANEYVVAMDSMNARLNNIVKSFNDARSTFY